MEETEIVEAVLRKQKLPDGVLGFEFQFGEDSTGDPALWIWFDVLDDLAPSKQKLTAYGSLAKAVKNELREKRISYWPFVRFRAAENQT